MKIHKKFLSLCVCTIWTLPAQGTEIMRQQSEENKKHTNCISFSDDRINKLYAEYKSEKREGSDKKIATMRISYPDNEDGDESKIPQQQKNKK